MGKKTTRKYANQVAKRCIYELTIYEAMMGWVFLLIAGVCEIGFTTFLKLSANFSKLWPSVGFFALAIMSFSSLSLSLSTIPLGTAYAVWTGIGAFGTAIVGIIFFGEPASVARILFLVALIASIIGLKVVSDV